ncbi:MAG: transporter [Spongiibacteraceae bacterium]
MCALYFLAKSVRRAWWVYLFFAANSAIAYSLFDPVPADKLRDLSTDRPDTTESPHTVDAGHYQIEWEAISYGSDRNDGVRTSVLTSSINLKAGLSDNVDLQLVLEPHTRVTTKAAGESDTESGMNDTEVRLKMNMWGNDEGETALAIMPFVRFATHDDDFGDDGKTEGGIIVPLGFTLPGGWESAVMVEVDRVRNEDNDGYITEFLQSITFAHDITENMGGFLEFVNDSRNESDAEAETYFNTGVTYALGANVQLDAGVNLGLSDAAEDCRVFVGFSYKR